MSRFAAWRQHPILRRLPMLVFVGVGLLLWKGGLFPQPRELVWQLGPRSAEIRSLEIQLSAEDHELIKREQRFFSAAVPAPREVVQSVTLREGRYQAVVLVRREGPGPEEVHRLDVRIGGEDTYALPIDGG